MHLLIWGIACAAFTALSLHPMQRPGTISFPMWFPSWLLCELPWHGAAGMVTVGIVLGVTGGAEPVGIAFVVASVLGLAHHAVLARRVGAVMESALAEGMEEALAIEPRKSATLGQLLGVLPFRPAGIEVTRDIPYAVGGRRRQLDVWRATGVGAGAKRPSFLFVHGGGWVIGDKELQGLCTVHALAEAGWVCFSMNYRLSPRAVFPDHLHDVKHAIAWIKRHAAEYGADPSFLVICGASAGGHLASLAALTPGEQQPELEHADTSVQGCVSYYGVYDLTGRDIPAPNRAFSRLLLEKVVFQRRQADDPKAFEDASPIAHARADAPPFFVLHGERDSLVPVVGARTFVARLRAVSRAPVVYAEVPGTQHAFELFHSPRSAAAVDAVRRFCVALHEARQSSELVAEA